MIQDGISLLLIVLLKFLVRNCSLVLGQIDNVFYFKHPVNAMVGLSTQTKMDHTKLAGYHNRHGRTTQAQLAIDYRKPSIVFVSFLYKSFRLHCKYLRPNYDQIAAYGRTTTVIPWFQPLVVGCQSIFIVDIGIKEKYRIQY